GLRLLLETNPDRARKVAELLEKMNRRRQNVEEQVLKEAEGMLATTDDVGKAIVLAGDWHPGVIGIVASRLAEKFYRPTVLLSIREEMAKGSARSIPGFHLFRALEKCASYLNTYGGHEFAAGVEVEKARLVDFKKAFLAVADLWLTNEMLTPCLEVEEVIEVAEVTKDLLNNLLQLAPFGAGNPEPILASRKVNIFSYNGVGKNAKHLKLKVGNEFARYEAIGFNYGSLAAQLEGIEWVDLAFNVTENDWNNQIQLVLKDLQPVAEVG
ncbi:MAG TPA: single-stranded-DNA-specific exonuclease RecJ, partial [Firmicutes bacterium]|nr:single-stranded-DNA-specific exonuclease RecJ [Bacillota bacterium]